MSAPLRVFVVEDEAVLLMQLESLLEDSGHTVVGTAITADEAIRLVGETQPELILLDLHLADGSSGLDVVRAIDARDDLTIVFLTANALLLSEDLEGAAGVIAKPFNEAAFVRSLNFLEECVRRPPPQEGLTHCIRLAPAFQAQIDEMRDGT